MRLWKKNALTANNLCTRPLPFGQKNAIFVN